MPGDQGDDDVLLILEMAGEERRCPVQTVSHAGGSVRGRRRLTDDGVMESQPGLKQVREHGVDRVVIPVHQVDPGPDTGFQLSHYREVAMGLDVVVTVEVLKEALQGRNELPVQVCQRQGTRAPAGGCPGHGLGLMSEMAVHLQPEAGGFTDLRLMPSQPRQILEQIPIRRRQAGPGREIVRHRRRSRR